MHTKHLTITGKVQGVGYRASFQRKAHEIGEIAGWVRNLSDGSVEAIIQGELKRLESLITWAQQGPKQAEVKNVDIKDLPNAADLPTPLQVAL